MLGEIELHLDLLAAGDAAMQSPAIVQDAVDHGVVLGRNGPGKFPPHQVMRQVGGEAQVRETVQQVQGEEQVRRHAVAVGLDMQLHAGIRRQLAPAIDVGNARFQGVGAHIRLQVQMIGAQFLHQRQHRLQVVHALGIALRLPGHAMGAQEAGDLAGERRIDEARAAAVKAGIPDHGQFFGQRPFLAVGTAPLHRP